MRLHRSFAAVALSALIGLMRGLLATVLGVVSWVVSGWAAFHFGDIGGQLGSPSDLEDRRLL